MMRKNFNIDAYLNEAETRFSSFDGMDDDDYEFENYGDENDYSMATGGGVDMLKSPSPYQITVTNTTAGALTAVLFGKNQYLLTANFGSSAALTVTPSQSNVTYLELLQQSAEQVFETSLIRIQSNVATQITQILTVTVKDANGQSATLPIVTQSYFSAYQQQSGILDVPYVLKIDGNTNITTPIAANSITTYTFFPAAKFNAAKDLAGKPAVQQYGNPQVNLGGMTFPKRIRIGKQNRR